jgi:CRP-like cAMP-binding protein
VAENGNIRFERKKTLALKGADGQLRETSVSAGRQFQRCRFAPGARIFSQGDPGDLAYVVEEGRVAIRQRRAGAVDGAEVEIAQIGAGAMFGELALIDGLQRTASAVALTATKCVAISPAQLDVHLAEASPQLSENLRLLLTFVRAVPARATWVDGIPSSVSVAELLAVHDAATVGKALAETEGTTAFARALYDTLCAYVRARFP